MEQGEIILYQPVDTIKLGVRMENETVWLSIEEMSNLFGHDISVIGKHIRNIFKEELVKDSVWAKFAYTAFLFAFSKLDIPAEAITNLL